MKTLRQLAKEYAHGQLKQADYRRHRTELIQNILNGKVEVMDRTFEAPLLPPEDDITEQSGFDPFATTQLAKAPLKPPQFDIGDEEATLPDAVASNLNRKPQPQPEPQLTTPFQRNKLTILLTATVIVLIIAIVLTFLMIRSGIDKPTTSVPVSNSEQVISDTPVSDKLIQDFLTTNNWQTTSLEEFLVQWKNLSHEQRSKASQSTRMNQLGSAIYKKILEEKALMAIGNAETNNSKQEELIQFALNVGINDPKITSP